MPATLESIHSFLNVKRLALVGLSRNPKHFSVALFNELLRRGYDVIPVNPSATEIQGRPCHARVQDIHPPVAAGLIMTPPAITDSAVADCAQPASAASGCTAPAPMAAPSPPPASPSAAIAGSTSSRRMPLHVPPPKRIPRPPRLPPQTNRRLSKARSRVILCAEPQHM